MDRDALERQVDYIRRALQDESLLGEVPCGCRKDKRNLIVCIDGTANQFGQKNTNVIELYGLIKKGEEHKQLTWYNSGIGTYARPSWKSLKYLRQVVNHKIDMAIAWNFESIVLDAYRWLSENYQPGDRIFMFGFSRGAYQVRALSAMIDKVGLIHKGNEKQIPFAYQLYADPLSGEVEAGSSDYTSSPVAESPSTGVGSPMKVESVVEKLPTDFTDGHSPIMTGHAKVKTMAERFKAAFSREVKVHFVGAWDTVSSVGIVRSKELPGTTTGMKHVCFFRHALALDERRVKFLPEYACGGLTASGGGSDSPAYSAHTQEVWFAGTHSDIGGGNVENPTLDRTRPPLTWMAFEAAARGLRLSPFGRTPNMSERIIVTESLKGPWRLLEVLPIKRLSYKSRDNSDRDPTTRIPHLGSGRIIQFGQKIHNSLWLSGTQDYIPKATVYGEKRRALWTTFNLGSLAIGFQAQMSWVRQDLHSLVFRLVTVYHDTEDADLKGKILASLRDVSRTEAGRMALFHTNVFDALKHLPLRDGRVLCDDLRSTREILNQTYENRPPAKFVYAQIYPILSTLLRSWMRDEVDTARLFVSDFTDYRPVCTRIFPKSSCTVVYAAFLPDCKRVISAWQDGTIHIRDMDAPQGLSQTKQSDELTCFACSADGKRAASGSINGRVHIWDVDNLLLVRTRRLYGQGPIRALAFLPDSQSLVCGVGNLSVLIHVEGTTLDSAEEYIDGGSNVSSITSFPDGRRILSGRGDGSVHVWDVRTRDVKVITLEGRGYGVSSVAISKEYVVSGLDDTGIITVQVWDATTAELSVVTQIPPGHQGKVKSIAFSPDGKHLVSGGEDKQIRVWDTRAWKEEASLQGHTETINSVAFSPNGRYIVSCSDDGTTRIWDAEKLVAGPSLYS